MEAAAERTITQASNYVCQTNRAAEHINVTMQSAILLVQSVTEAPKALRLHCKAGKSCLSFKFKSWCVQDFAESRFVQGSLQVVTLPRTCDLRMAKYNCSVQALT